MTITELILTIKLASLALNTISCILNLFWHRDLYPFSLRPYMFKMMISGFVVSAVAVLLNNVVFSNGWVTLLFHSFLLLGLVKVNTLVFIYLTYKLQQRYPL